MFAAQGRVVHCGVDAILVHSSVQFAQAATTVGLAAHSLVDVAERDIDAVLHGLQRSVATLRTGLLAAARGLPVDVRAVLDERPAGRAADGPRRKAVDRALPKGEG